jgi:DNA helicase-2/ATP-dependent DNA helicase PcrA
MQQIYKNYDGSFEEEFESLNKEISLKINHRSIPAIVDILNNIYNDDENDQQIYEENKKILPDYNPKIVLCKDMKIAVERNKADYPDSLILFLFNKDKFSEMGAENLYDSFNKMEKYSFSHKYKATDILSDQSPENPDPLMRFLFLVHKAIMFFMKGQYGNIIKLCKDNRQFFHPETYSILHHNDKKRIKSIWEDVLKTYNDQVNISSIQEFLNVLSDKKIIGVEYINNLYETGEYDVILSVKINEFKRLADYLEDPHISTQHGVKGESHDMVIFVADNSSNNPVVYMYKFFEIWSNLDFSLKDFEKFYYEYYKFIIDVENELGIKINDLNAESHNKNERNKALLMRKSKEILELFEGNSLFESLCKNFYVAYLAKPIVGNIKKCFKDSTVYGVLSAYRLFYVGCSRARRNLTILVSESHIRCFRDLFIEKAKKTGFEIVEQQENNLG